MFKNFVVLFLILVTNSSFSQRTVILTQTQNNAIKGIDRKAWAGIGNVSGHSDGYANDFTLPAIINPCEKITNVKVDVVFTGYNNTSACPHTQTFFNIFYDCTLYTGGATCPIANVISETPYPVNTNPASFNFNTSGFFDFGKNFSVDIIPVSNPGCNPVTSGGLTHTYETTVTVTITDIPLILDIIDPAPVCSGTSVDITLPTIIKAGSTTGTTFTYWADAAGTIVLPNPTAITTSGTYYIKSALGSCSIIKPVVVTIVNKPSPPTVSSTVNYCNSKPATPLKATPTPGFNLNWYGTSATGGVPSNVAPTPTGNGTYYVSQSVGLCESNRTFITVGFISDNGTVISSFICDSNKIAQADLNSSVYFDWNQPATISNRFNYSYTIAGNPPVTGYIPGTGTNLQVFGMIPGQWATITITSESNPCTEATKTCFVPCPFPKPTSDFDTTPQKYCDGASIPPFSLSSPNGITGKWNPPTISSTTIGETIYTFTPDNLCAIGQNISVTIIPNEAPTFTGSETIKSELCENEVYSLPTKSTNNINGTWSPSTLVDTSVVGITPFYTFTPNVGECFNATVTFPPISIDVKPSLVTSYIPLADFCAGTTPAPSFPIVTSVPPIIGGIIGGWLPDTISTVAGLNQKYQFTPITQCATTPPEMTVNVNPSPEPTFFPLVPEEVCEGATILLPTSSIDTPPITGTWSTLTVNPITTIDTSIVGTDSYTFTPDGLQCAKAPPKIDITVNPSGTLINVDTTVTNAFEDNQIITVVATAPGNYLYQLDSGPLQTSPIFENVSAGIHQITVSDANGCSTAITETDILVIKHPKFFTPNADGFNDTWKLSGLTTSLITKIYIFDRYGKLLKEISADGTGWDGTYLGVPMPADDYWFTVDYLENLTPKKFKSHFSLKR